jgi:hypothetical protein
MSMIAFANDTLVLDGPVVRATAAPATPDRTKDLMRIVRHALTAGRATSPLDRAIRSAAGVSGSARLDAEDAADRARVLAPRINALFMRRAAPAADPHRETVRA